MKPAEEKAFQAGVAWAAEEMRADVVSAIAAVIIETRRECAAICRANGHEISAVEIEQLGELKQ